MRPKLFLLAVFTLLLGGCSSCPTAPPNPTNCGEVTGFKPSTTFVGQSLLQLHFNHTPATCPCQCRDYWFVQILRPLDLNSGEFIHPNDTQQDRMVTGQADEFFNGWSVDRFGDRKYGFYIVDDDFKIPPPEIPGQLNQRGSATSSAALHDTLGPAGDLWGGRPMQIVALSTAVCLDVGTGCTAKILGMSKWMVVFGADGTVNPPTQLTADSKDAEAFRLAVQAWNDHLDDGRVGLPTFTFP